MVTNPVPVWITHCIPRDYSWSTKDAVDMLHVPLKCELGTFPHSIFHHAGHVERPLLESQSKVSFVDVLIGIHCEEYVFAILNPLLK